MTDAIKEAYANAPADITYYDTLEIMHASFSESIKIVKSGKSLSTPQGNFIAVNFDFTIPETKGSVVGEMKISIGLLPKVAQVAIRDASMTTTPITVKYRQYLGANMEPDAELPVALEIRQVEQTYSGVVATALFPDLHGHVFPRRLMTTSVLPGGLV